MKKIVIVCAALLGLMLSVNAQAPHVEWLNAYHTNFWQNPTGNTVLDIKQLSTGGLLVAGKFTGEVNFNPQEGNGAETSTIWDDDGFFAKYDSKGKLIWVKVLIGIGDGNVHHIDVDSVGDIYVSGEFSDQTDFDPSANTVFKNTNDPGHEDIFFAKYSSTGNLIWVHNVGGWGADEVSAMQVSADGNITMEGEVDMTFNDSIDVDPGAGSFWFKKKPQTTTSLFFLQYNNGGSFQWGKQFGWGSGDNHIADVSIAPNGNLNICGRFRGTTDFEPGPVTVNRTSNGFSDAFYGRYQPDGEMIQVRTFGTSHFDNAEAIATDAAGNIYITGEYEDTMDIDPNAGVQMLPYNWDEITRRNAMYLAKFNGSGNLVWAKSISQVNSFTSGDLLMITPDNKLLLGITTTGNIDVDFDAAQQNYSVLNWDNVLVKYDLDAHYMEHFAIKADGLPAEINTATYGNNNDLFLGGVIADITYFSDNVVFDGFTQATDYTGFMVRYATGPANDAVCTATQLTVNAPAITTTNNNAGSDNISAGVCFDDDTVTSGVWFSFVAPQVGKAVITTYYTNGMDDSQIAVFESIPANDCNGLFTEISCNETPNEVSAMAIDSVFGLTPGSTYYILVDGNNDNSGSFNIDVTAFDPTGINDVFEQSNISIYPNPSTGLYNVKTDGHFTNYTITDISGRIVAENNSGTNNFTIDLSNNAPGMYFISLKNSANVITRTLVLK